ncbi:betaine--homocysteine S-methyltransferase 1 isoform X2 [Narcine bancroftii]|uniref:betaine--homocysteine S-methyltransferase 1 isoform X2 n=1 Tax=Narcine bancroftii TaxID=1343680 RepID=UPI0038310827
MPPVGRDGEKAAERGLLERLASGEIIIGDGGFVFALEKRGFVKAGPWTPEATVEHPEAVRQLHREFLRAGSTVLQTFTFYGSDDKLMNRGNYVEQKFTSNKVNEAACDIAKEVANEGGALVAGGVSQTPSYLSNKSETDVKAIFRKQLGIFVKKNVDFLLAEYFEHVEEAEWAVHVLKESGKPVGVTLCIGPEGDLTGVSAGDCAVRLVKAALEPRILTRWDMHKYARSAYNMGIRYIGGCCGFEPYHIRAIAEELAVERGFFPVASEKHDTWGGGLAMHTKPWVRARAQQTYWENLVPGTGRPYSASFSKPDNWGTTKGDEDLIQQVEATSDSQLKHLIEKQKKVASIKA